MKRISSGITNHQIVNSVLLTNQFQKIPNVRFIKGEPNFKTEINKAFPNI